jgi:hypothetical protein
MSTATADFACAEIRAAVVEVAADIVDVVAEVGRRVEAGDVVGKAVEEHVNDEEKLHHLYSSTLNSKASSS